MPRVAVADRGLESRGTVGEKAGEPSSGTWGAVGTGAGMVPAVGGGGAVGSDDVRRDVTTGTSPNAHAAVVVVNVTRRSSATANGTFLLADDDVVS